MLCLVRGRLFGKRWDRRVLEGPSILEVAGTREAESTLETSLSTLEVEGTTSFPLGKPFPLCTEPL